MQQEIIHYPFDELDSDDRESSDSFQRDPEEVFIDRPGTSGTQITYVNGHNLPDEDDDEDEDEDDLVLGDEDDLDEDDLAEDEIDVEVDDVVDTDISEDDLLLDADEEDDEEDEL